MKEYTIDAYTEKAKVGNKIQSVNSGRGLA